MADFPANIQSGTPKNFRFTLISDIKTVICDTEPLEWKSGAINFARDLDAGGVFVSFVCDSLTFVGNGAAMLKEIYDAFELTQKAKCELKIEYWKEFDFVTPANGRRYIEFPSRFSIDFNFFETVKVGSFSMGVKVKAVNSSMQSKFDSRQDIDVSVTKLVSIGGFEIPDWPVLKKNLYFDETNVSYVSQVKKDQYPGHPSYEDFLKYWPYNAVGRWDLPRVGSGDGYTGVPLDVTSKDSEMAEVQAVKYITQVSPLQLNKITSFFKNALFDKDLEISYDINVIITNEHSVTPPYTVQILETYDINPTGVKAETIIADGGVYEIGTFGHSKGFHTFKDMVPITVHKGNDLKLVIITGCIQDIGAEIWSAKLDIVQQIAQSPATLTEGLPIYKALERTLQHDLDVQFPLYSDFFGTVDDIYKPDGTKYASENQLRFAHIQSGLNQRGIKIDDSGSPLALNFKKLWQCVKAIWNVGYTFEVNAALFGDSNPRIRIEEYSYFFQNTEIVLDPPLSSRINKYDILKKVMPELVPVDIKSGFDSYEYLSINGRAEPNTTNQRTTPVITASKVEIISGIRGDTKGMVDNLSNPVILTRGSTDTKGDTDIFIVKTQKIPGVTPEGIAYDWKPEKAENIVTLNQTSLFKEDLLNRYFTPSRILIRHGNRIKAGMLKLSDTDVLRFQTSDKANNLSTSGLIGSGLDYYDIIESQDIPMSRLAAPIFKANQYTITIDFDFADLAAIQANPLGYLKLSDEISIYLLPLKKINDSGKADITGIERNVILS